MFPEALVLSAVFGAYICEDWELRVTTRCLEEDLGLAQGSSFNEFETKHPVLATSFKKNRSSTTTGTRTVNVRHGGRDVWSLPAGNDHRGASWYSEAERIVWLVAFGPHRSGAENDFYAWVPELAASGVLAPTQTDYVQLHVERDQRLAESLPVEAAILMRRAEEAPGEKQSDTLGGKWGVTVTVTVVEEVNEIHVSFDLEVPPPPPELLRLILAAIVPGEEWSVSLQGPDGVAGENEVVYSCMFVAQES